MSLPRIIRKYPNRRLYDSGARRYIRTGEILEMINQRVDFIVVDRATGRNITRAILLQLIAELEQQGPVLTDAFLLDVIRADGTASQAAEVEALERPVPRADQTVPQQT